MRQAGGGVFGEVRDPVGWVECLRTHHAAKIRISNGALLAGSAPNKVLRQARRWIEEHQAELLALWDEFQR
jgi:hypothetical protein